MSSGYVALIVFILVTLSIVFLVPAMRKISKSKVTIKQVFLKPKLEYGMLYIYLFSVICILATIESSGFDENRDPDEVIEYAKKEELFEHQYWAYNKKLKKYRYDFEAVYYINLAQKKANETKDKFFEWSDNFNSIRILNLKNNNVISQ